MKWPLIVVIFALVACAGQSAAQAAGEEKIDSDLRHKLEYADPAELFIVWIDFADRPAEDTTPDDGLPPVNMGYVERVWSSPGVKPRFIDELSNSVSAEATAAAIFEVASYDFVARISEVPVGSIGDVGGTDGGSSVVISGNIQALLLLLGLGIAGLAGLLAWAFTPKLNVL